MLAKDGEYSGPNAVVRGSQFWLQPPFKAASQDGALILRSRLKRRLQPKMAAPQSSIAATKPRRRFLFLGTMSLFETTRIEKGRKRHERVYREIWGSDQRSYHRLRPFGVPRESGPEPRIRHERVSVGQRHRMEGLRAAC